MTVTPEQLQATEEFMKIASTPATTLWSLTGQWADLLYELDDADLDLDRAEELEAIVGELAGKITDKAEGIACVIRELNYRAAAQRAEASRLVERAGSRERKAEWLMCYLQEQMRIVGTRQIDTVRYTLSIRVNPPHVEVLEPAMVPGEFTRVIPAKVEPDKKAILAAYKRDGLVVPGTEVLRSERLEIR